MSTILWLTVNSSYSHSSLALPIIHLACKNITGWQWCRYDTLIEDDPAEAALKILQKKPDVVAAPLYLFNRNATINILTRIHAIIPKCKLIVGGPECLGEGAKEVLENCPAIDITVSGEGESVFPLLLQALQEEKTLPQIPGLNIRNRKTGEIIDNAGQAQLYADWATAPSPMQSPFFLTNKPFIQLETARGCAQGCLYCTSGNSKVRCKSIKKVTAELAEAHQHGILEIRLLDRTFNLPPTRAAQLLHLFRTQFPDLKIHLEIHPQFLFSEIREELEKALPGQLFIEAGLQSLSPEVQNAIGRKSIPEKDMDGLRFLCECTAFETHVDLISGLPKQTLESIFNDINELFKIAPGEIQTEILKILPGTPMKHQAKDLGIIYCPIPPYDVIQTASMSAQEIITTNAISRVLDQFYNQPALQQCMLSACQEKKDTFKNLLHICQERDITGKRPPSLKHRFLLLTEIWSPEQYPHTREKLAYAWMKAGFPAGETPAQDVTLCPKIPDNAPLIEGNTDVISQRTTKLYKLHCQKKNFFFAFNRAYIMNAPAAIFQEDI